MYYIKHQIKNSYSKLSDETGNLYMGQSAGKKIAQAMFKAKKSIRIFSYNIGLSSFILEDPVTQQPLTVKELLRTKISENVQVTLALDNATLTPEDKLALSHLFILQSSHELPDKVTEKEAQQNTCNELRQKNAFIGRMLYLLFLIVPIIALGYIFFEKINLAFLFTEATYVREIHLPLIIELLQQLLVLIFIIASFTIVCVFARTTTIKYLNRNCAKMEEVANSIPIRSFQYTWLGNLVLVHYNDAHFHAKMYIIDDKIAFVGSPNFTSSGFYKNYECRVEIKDLEVVKVLAKNYDDTIASIKENHKHTSMEMLAQYNFIEDFFT